MNNEKGCIEVGQVPRNLFRGVGEFACGGETWLARVGNRCARHEMSLGFDADRALAHVLDGCNGQVRKEASPTGTPHRTGNPQQHLFDNGRRSQLVRYLAHGRHKHYTRKQIRTALITAKANGTTHGLYAKDKSEIGSDSISPEGLLFGCPVFLSLLSCRLLPRPLGSTWTASVQTVDQWFPQKRKRRPLRFGSNRK